MSDKKVSAFTAATAIKAPDIIPIVQSGATKRLPWGSFPVDPPARQFAPALQDALTPQNQDHEAFPVLAVSKTGETFFLVYRESTQHAVGESRLVLRKSTDYGQTWGSATEIVTGIGADKDFRDQSFGVTSTGRLVCIYQEITITGDVRVLKAVVSDDQGSTWSLAWSDATIPASYNSIGASPMTIHEAGGRLFSGFYSVTTANMNLTYSACLVSDDNGNSWTRHDIVASTIGEVEPVILPITDTSIACVVRVIGSGHQYQLRLYWSNNAGETWTAKGYITTLAFGDTAPTIYYSGPVAMSVHDSDRGPLLYLVYGDRIDGNLKIGSLLLSDAYADPSTLLSDAASLVTVSNAPGACPYGGYPSIIVNRSGQCLVAYYFENSTGTTAEIRFVRAVPKTTAFGNRQDITWNPTTGFLGLGTSAPSVGCDMRGSENPFLHGYVSRNTAITIPDFSAIGGLVGTSPTPVFAFGAGSSTTGGGSLWGVTTNAAGSVGMMITGLSGMSGTPTEASVVLRGGKHNGTTGATAVAAGERLIEVRNWTTANILVMTGDGSTSLGSFPNASAKLQADSTTKGFLPPRMTTAQKNAISSPAAGLQVFDSTLASQALYNGSAWETFISSASGGLSFDKTNKRVGIGTDTPLTGLHLVGNSAVTFAHNIYLTNQALTMPNLNTIYSSIGWSGTTGWIASFATASSSTGGAQMNGISSSGTTNGFPILITGYHGASGTITNSSVILRGAKWDGSTSAQALAATEPVGEFRNWTTTLCTILGSGAIKMASATLLATPQNGCLEYDGTHLYFTASGGTRTQIV